MALTQIFHHKVIRVFRTLFNLWKLWMAQRACFKGRRQSMPRL